VGTAVIMEEDRVLNSGLDERVNIVWPAFKETYSRTLHPADELHQKLTEVDDIIVFKYQQISKTLILETPLATHHKIATPFGGLATPPGT
jgi:hypothetical protein